MAFLFKSGPLRVLATGLRPVYRGFSRGTGGRNDKKHGIRGRKGAIDLVDQLDAAKGEGVRSSRTGGRLKKSLVKKESPELDPVSQGSMDATSEEIRDVLNEHLESFKFAYAFKGFKKASELVEIVELQCNHDYSCATAMWRASSMERLVKSMEAKHGEKEANTLAKRIIKNIDQVFREKEGIMRTNLMRKMDFKRVPKLMFRPKDSSLGLVAPLQGINPLLLRPGFFGNYIPVEDMDTPSEEGRNEMSRGQRVAEDFGEEGEDYEEAEEDEGDYEYDTDEYSDLDDGEMGSEDEDLDFEEDDVVPNKTNR